MADKLVYYFGYVPGHGHGLRAPGQERRSFRDQELKDVGFPWDQNWIDGSLLKNGKVPDQPDGRVFWTGGGKPNFWFAFYWWDRSGDKRGASNTGLYVRGFEPKREQAPEAFKYACEVWPDVVKRQHHPLVLQLAWNIEPTKEPT